MTFDHDSNCVIPEENLRKAEWATAMIGATLFIIFSKGTCSYIFLISEMAVEFRRSKQRSKMSEWIFPWTGLNFSVIFSNWPWTSDCNLVRQLSLNEIRISHVLSKLSKLRTWRLIEKSVDFYSNWNVYASESDLASESINGKMVVHRLNDLSYCTCYGNNALRFSFSTYTRNVYLKVDGRKFDPDSEAMKVDGHSETKRSSTKCSF